MKLPISQDDQPIALQQGEDGTQHGLLLTERTRTAMVEAMPKQGNCALFVNQTHHQQIMVFLLRPVNHEVQVLPPMKLLLDPMFDNGKPQSFDIELRQLQKSPEVAMATFKLNRLSKQSG